MKFKQFINFFKMGFESKRSFEAVQTNRLFPAVSSPISINEDLITSIEGLRARARELAKNDPYAKKFLKLMKANIVGEKGITLQSKIKDKNGVLIDYLNKEIEEKWKEFSESKNIDVSRKSTILELLYIAVNHLARDGEAIARHVRGYNNKWGYAVQMINPSLLDEKLNFSSGTKKIVMGIELDEWDSPIAYYFLSNRGDTVVKGNKYTVVSAEEIMHVFLCEDADQVRGITDFATVIKQIRMLNGYVEAELVNSRIAASRSAFFQRKEGYEGDDSFDGETKGSSNKINPSPIKMAQAGSISFVPDGYELAEFNPNNPNAQFGEFSESQLGGVATGLNVGKNELTSNYTGVNYTSLRAAALADREQYKIVQGYMIRSFCQPIFENWLESAYLSNMLKYVRLNTLEMCKKPRWQARRWGWVDPLKDGKGQIMLKNERLMSLEEIAAERGKDLEELIEEIAREKELLEFYGLKELEKTTNINLKDNP